jgi:5-formyltetrahydrofolate cyclo-ligase
MLKKEVRKTFREKREALSYIEQVKWDDLILIQFQTLDLPFLNTVFSYYPVEENKEINSFLLTDFLRFRNPNLQLCYPKMHTEHTGMDAIICNADTPFETNPFNIPEPVANLIADPEEIDLVIVPLLAFDTKGIRVGYGKGYYDRYLQRCRKDCIKLGLSYFEPVHRIEDAHEFDLPLDFCITPQQVYVF